MFTTRDCYFMQQAMILAHTAKDQQEVPIGAVLVVNDEIIGVGYNCPIAKNDPTAHAEIIALRHAAEKIKNYRLPNSTLYVTLEPCTMCAGAIVHARINRLVFGANDPKAGAIVSQSQTFNQSFLNHRVETNGGLFADECGLLLSRFFQERR